MLVDESRAVIASLEAQATSLHVEISDLRRAADAAETDRVRLSAALAERMDAANRLRGELRRLPRFPCGSCSNSTGGSRRRRGCARGWRK